MKITLQERHRRSARLCLLITTALCLHSPEPRPGSGERTAASVAQRRQQRAGGGRRTGHLGRRDHRHRAEAGGKLAVGADQHPGAADEEARAASDQELRRLHQISSKRQHHHGQHRETPATPRSPSAASPPMAGCWFRAPCPPSAPISTSSRSRRSPARRTSTSMTSRGSKRWRAARHAVRRLQRGGDGPDHHQQARDQQDQRQLQPGVQPGRRWRPGRHSGGLRQSARGPDKAALRVVGWYDHTGGFISNILHIRTFPTSKIVESNAGLLEKTTPTPATPTAPAPRSASTSTIAGR